MNEGNIICYSNGMYNGIYYISSTKQDPIIKINHMNNENIYLPFKFEFCKKNVSNYQEKKNVLYNLLNKYRVHPKKEFFNINLDYLKTLLDLMDGEWYTEKTILDNTNNLYCKIVNYFNIKICKIEDNNENDNSRL